MIDESQELAFFNFYTASLFGHKEARAYLGLMFENGLSPSSRMFLDNVWNEEGQFHFLDELTSK